MEISVKSAMGFQLVYSSACTSSPSFAQWRGATHLGHAPSPRQPYPGSLLQGHEHPMPSTS